MPQVDVVIDIKAPPDRVWSLVSDPLRYPE